ncbi:MAG: 6,7-dimethyl-8-ribityllumazine synthase [Flavobacteriaceae bacterium]|nr:6,7-dimethyl-8-ribityllumazine synthase [Flavobacteriaceae bacterium]
MNYSGINIPKKVDENTFSSRKKYKISLIVSEWNNQITSKLLEGAIETLIHNGILNENIFITKVPGSFELIFEAKKKSKESKFDSIIVIGCLIKGDTKHFKYLCKSVSYAIARINLKSLIPVIFCVLMDNNIEQSNERSGGKFGNKGIDAAYTSIKMMELNKS